MAPKEIKIKETSPKPIAVKAKGQTKSSGNSKAKSSASATVTMEELESRRRAGKPLGLKAVRTAALAKSMGGMKLAFDAEKSNSSSSSSSKADKTAEESEKQTKSSENPEPTKADGPEEDPSKLGKKRSRKESEGDGDDEPSSEEEGLISESEKEDENADLAADSNFKDLMEGSEVNGEVDLGKLMVKSVLDTNQKMSDIISAQQEFSKQQSATSASSTSGATVLQSTVRAMNTVTNSEIARLENEFNTQKASGVTLTVPQAVSSKLRPAITSLLLAEKYLEPTNVNEWLGWEIPVLMACLRKIVGATSGDHTNIVQTVAVMIRETTHRITSRGKEGFTAFLTEVWTKVLDNLDAESIADKTKETLFAVRASVMYVFGLSHFGKQIAKTWNQRHIDDWAFSGWFQGLIDTYFELAAVANEGRRLIEDEIRDEVIAELGGKKPPTGNLPSGGKGSGKNKDGKHKDKRPRVDTDTTTKQDPSIKKGNNCFGCGKRHPGDCSWSEHPDWNHESMQWALSTKGLAIIKDNPKAESLPTWSCLDKSKLPAWEKKAQIIKDKMKASYTKKGKSPQKAKYLASKKEVNSILREDTIHDVDNIPFTCDDNGIRRCTLINPLDNSTLMSLRVMLDTGALGQGSNYISKEVASRLKEFGYEPKSVDRVVCGCFVGSSKRITENFKLKLSFREPDDTVKQVTVACDVINTKHDVIIGYNTIKHCSYIRELMTRNISQEPEPQFNMEGLYCQEEFTEGLEGATNEGSHGPDDVVESRTPEVNVINPVLLRSEDRTNGLNTSESDKMSDNKNKSESDIKSDEILDENIQLIKFGGSPSLQQGARTLCEELKEGLFSMDINEKSAKITPMEIELTAEWETKENCLNPRLQSQLKDKEISAQVAKMLEKQVISDRSRATAHSQVMLTVKPDGSWRFCIDYRRLNVITKPNAWPLPRIKQTLQRIGEKKPSHFAVVDLTKGFFQLEMAKKCQHLTAFVTRDGKYEWRRVPMGLTGAPAYFQRAMSNEVLVGLVHHICEVYLDDVIIYGTTEAEFLANLKTVFERFKEFDITLNPKKCKIGLSEIEYVGHVINKDGITFSREKLQKVIDVPLPETCKQLRSFVGLANYFRDHVENHSSRIEPLIRLLVKYDPKRRIEWDKHPEAYPAFQDIKLAVNQCPQLFFMDDVSPIHLYTDASIKGVGAYLCQKRADGHEYPIAFFSKSLNSTEQNWGVPELEGYAIYAAFQHFDYLLRDNHTHVHTDHKNLVYIRDTGSDKVLRWKMMLQEYSFTLEHVAGVDNPIADFWSRNEAAEVDTYLPNEPKKQGNMLCTLTPGGDEIEHLCTTEGIAHMLRSFAEIEQESNELNNLENELNANTKQFEIPHDKYEQIKAVHNPRVGHHGVDTTMEKLQKKGVSWKYMRQHVKKFCHECDTCQKNSYSKLDIRVKKYTTGSYYPMERLMIDTVSIPEDTWGNKGVVVIIDCFSRYMTCYPVKTFDAEEAAEILLIHTGHYGVPAQLFSDGGGQYVNAIIASFLEMTGTEHVVGMAYSHQEQTIVERSIRELSRWVRDLLHDSQVKHKYWSRYLPFAQRIHNASTIKSIGFSPAEILFGDRLSLDTNILIPQDLRVHKNTEINEWMMDRERYQDSMIKVAQKLQKTHEDEHLQEQTPALTDFPVDSYVLVAYPETGYGPRRPNKLFMMHRGPFKIISRKDNLFTLQNLVTDKTVDKPIYLLRPYFWNEQETTPDEEAKKDLADAYDVEEILEHKGQWARKTSLTFLVKWYGYESSENTWESWANVSTSEHLDTYLIKHNREKLSPRYAKPGK